MAHPVLIPKLKRPPQGLYHPGPWWLGFNPTEENLNPAPMLRCPYGHRAILSRHDIAADGAVKPSIVCPEEACTWHVWGLLEGWNRPARAGDP